MEKQGTKYKVFVVVLLCATLYLLDVKATKEFPTAGYDIVISSRQKYINSSGILFSKVGTSLVLDCSISNKSVQIEWKTSKDIHGTSIRLQNTSVIQYKIDKVTWNMNGSVFWCRPAISMDGIDGVKATVIVGDIPSPPRDFSSSIYDVNLYIVRLSWKQALYTGRLPAYYKISYYQCYNKTYIPSHPEYNFCRTSHISGRKDYSCSMKRDDMVNLPIKSEQLCEIFHVTLVTVNNIGVSDAVNMSLYLGYGGETPFMPTPLPPSHLQAEAQGSYITVRWKTRDYYQLIDPTYIILYHAEKDTKNKTKEVKNQKMVTLRDGIKPYTKYYIYLMVEVSHGDRSQTSEAIGPVTTTTDEGEPKQGPSISGINNIVHDNDNTVRDVALQWEFKEPMVSSWQGKPANITVHYRNIAKQSTYEKITLPASQEVPRNVTLTGLNSDNDYQAYTTLCNTKHCGGMGPQTLVKSLAGPAIDPSNEKNTGENDHLSLAVSLGVSGLVLVIVAVGMIVKYRNRSTRTGAQPLHEIVPTDQLHPHHGKGYEELADKVTVNEYTSANQL